MTNAPNPLNSRAGSQQNGNRSNASAEETARSSDRTNRSKGILLKLASNLFFILLIICCTVYRLSLSLTFYTYVHVEENKDKDVKRNLVLFFVCVIPEILVKFPSSDILAVTNTEDETLVKQQP